MTDHTPSLATDGLREAVEALLDEYTRRHRYLSQAVLSTTDVLTDLRAILAAHPASPSETAPEGEVCPCSNPGRTHGPDAHRGRTTEETQP